MKIIVSAVGTWKLINPQTLLVLSSVNLHKLFPMQVTHSNQFASPKHLQHATMDYTTDRGRIVLSYIFHRSVLINGRSVA